MTDRIEKVLETVGMTDFTHHDLSTLSGGEKQKVELVKTILKDADVYFFDEPTAHLDQESRDEYYQYLKKQKDKIIVVVSHNSQERQYFDVIYEV